ncbi:MAG: hypothetical protein KIS63_10040 [Caldilineales bacterium]|nr:hypothetical protein [Caldilineales bacterium]
MAGICTSGAKTVKDAGSVAGSRVAAAAGAPSSSGEAPAAWAEGAAKGESSIAMHRQAASRMTIL